MARERCSPRPSKLEVAGFIAEHTEIKRTTRPPTPGAPWAPARAINHDRDRPG